MVIDRHRISATAPPSISADRDARVASRRGGHNKTIGAAPSRIVAAGRGPINRVLRGSQKGARPAVGGPAGRGGRGGGGEGGRARRSDLGVSVGALTYIGREFEPKGS